MALKFRRGTTAQQSGSLAFGEPFVNTTLGTLLVGGASGDIALAVAGTGSTGTFGPISGSGLDITGNANIAGNLTLGGNITIGDAGTDSVVINADLSSSLIPNNDNAFTIGSEALRYSNIYGVNIIGSIAATNGVVSGSSQITYASVSSIPAGIVSGAAQVTPLLPTGVVSGSVQVTLGSTTGFSTYNTALQTITGSLVSSASADRISITNLNTLTASALTRLTALEVETSNLETFSGSQLSKDSTLATYTGSNDTKWSTLGSLSGSFARTNSTNIFSGNQTITGSLFVSQDLVVAGSSSIQNISSSTLNIGTNLITVAVNQPSVRFGGIAVIDSGSAGASGSLLYDSTQDEFIFVHKGNGVNVTSSVLLMGPQTYDNLGNETYLTNNKITKGTGLEHIVDSQITDDGSTVSIPGALTVTGNITGPIRATNGVVSGSSQITYASISSIPAGIVSGAAQVTPLLPTGTVSGSSQVALASTTGFGTYLNQAVLTTSTPSFSTITSTVSTGTAPLTVTSTTAVTNLNADLWDGNHFATLGTWTGSVDSKFTTLATLTGSNGARLTSLESYTGSFAAASVTLTNKTLAAASNTISGLTNANLSGTAGITNANLANSSVTVTAGTGMSGGGAVSLGGSVTLTNAGVTSAVAGTGVSVSGATGAVTISIGQSVATTSTPTFGNLTINGTITATGDITAYYTSDRRHKNNIQTISNAVLKVKQLNGVTWEWNDDVNEVTKSTPKTGLIAQEVQQVLPQVVTERADGFLALDYSKMVGLLVEAIKEQQIQIDQLKAQIGSK